MSRLGAENVLYLDMDGEYMNVYTCIRSLGCTLKKCVFAVISVS